MKIILNGEKVARIKQGETLVVELQEDENILKIRHFGSRSNEVEVGEGDVLEIKPKRCHQMLFPLLIVITFIMDVILGAAYITMILPVHIVILLISFGTEGYAVKKVHTDT